jgi:dihydrofolate synthase/folylpolyglutamate synthase
MTEYQRTLEYLFAQLPMFQRLGASAFKKDLGNTIALCDALGNPQHDFRSIHVAGTNGKGSTSHFLASVLQSAGYRVGLYTSPHLKDFRERIKVNGAMISEEEVIRFTNDNRSHFDRIQPSFFEMTVAMAFHHFRERKVDIAVIETGMGGRLDSTNVITPLLSIITNIGHDHQQFLGETLARDRWREGGDHQAGRSGHHW